MELEKLREQIEKTKGFQANPACRELAECFEEFVFLHQMQKEGIAEPEYFERFEKCLVKFWDSFDKAAASLGISADLIKSNLNNPAFFTPDQWKNVQALRSEITGVEETPRRKKMKKSKNLRI